MVLRIDGQLFWMAEFEHHKPGKGAAVVRTKLKNVKTGAVTDRTYRSGDKVDDVRLERRKMQFLYKGDFFTFMDNESYEQFELNEDIVGDAVKYLKENEVSEDYVPGKTPCLQFKGLKQTVIARGQTRESGGTPRKSEGK